jgi:hypothetical protein
VRTILAGSRELTDPVLLESAIIESGFEITLVVSGGARGVDLLGEEWARKNGIPVERYKPDWKRFGKRAGVMRNSDLVSKAEALVARWDGKSTGTRDVIRKAQETGLRVFVKQVGG